VYQKTAARKDPKMQRLQRAGLGLAYDDTAHPDRPPMLLLHGWCSRRADLAALADTFAAFHRVVRLDLPGHGDSDVPADEDRLAVASFATDVAALCDALDLGRSVVVGHSGGAAVAVELAVRRPELVAAVAALDGTLGFPAELVEQTAAMRAALRGPAWREVVAGFLAAGFLPSDDQDLLRRTVEDVIRMPQHVVAGVGERIADWDAEAALAAFAATGIPLLYVQSAAELVLADQDRLAKLVPDLILGRVVGLGHDQLVATPAQPAAMIERFLAGTAVAAN
jgi:pimeloyl-ACP methyl ester carboxylesterase